MAIDHFVNLAFKVLNKVTLNKSNDIFFLFKVFLLNKVIIDSYFCLMNGRKLGKVALFAVDIVIERCIQNSVKHITCGVLQK